jgi:hypothetical protein
MGAEPTLAEIVRLALESRLLDLHVALPCRVESYDATTQTIEALPMVRRAITDTASWPLAPGDFVLVVFCSSAIGNWRESGDIADPGDLRRHDLSHAVAIPGIGPKGSTIPTSPTAAVLEVTAPATHVAVGAAATDFAALASKVEGIVGALAAEILNATAVPNDGGAAIQTAAKTALGLLGWTGGGTTPPANSTAATKLKSE